MTRWLLLGALAALVMWALGARRVRPRPGTTAGAPFDPHAVLGVPPGASRETITRRYHEELKRYHPDRVADLGEELQELAHRKTLELRRAYEALLAGTPRRPL